MSRRKKISALGLISVLVAVSIALTIGVAWGRFRTELTGNIYFQDRAPTPIYLFGSKAENGGYNELPDQWTVTQNGAGSSLSVVVTNGVGEEYAKRDVHFHLRLAATEGIGGAENLKIALYVDVANDDVAVYNAVVQQIAENTSIYEQFGNGWVYRFCDSDGNEVEFTLPGGTKSECSVVLVCEQANLGADPNLLQLQVVARDN